LVPLIPIDRRPQTLSNRPQTLDTAKIPTVDTAEILYTQRVKFDIITE